MLINISRFPLYLLFFVLTLMTGCAGSLPKNIGLQKNQLAPCPSSPNCVSSYEIDEKHSVKTIVFDTDITVAFQAMVKLLNNRSNVQIVENSNNYLHAEFRSSIFGFIDDLELYFSHGEINIRSASRVGYSDFGVNRKRVENLRDSFRKAIEH